MMRFPQYDEDERFSDKAVQTNFREEPNAITLNEAGATISKSVKHLSLLTKIFIHQNKTLLHPAIISAINNSHEQLMQTCDILLRAINDRLDTAHLDSPSSYSLFHQITQHVNTTELKNDMNNTLFSLQHACYALKNASGLLGKAVQTLSETARNIGECIEHTVCANKLLITMTKEAPHSTITQLNKIRQALMHKKARYEKRIDKTGVKKLAECAQLIEYVDKVGDALQHNQLICTVAMKLPLIHWTPFSELAKIRKAIKKIRDDHQAVELAEKKESIKKAKSNTLGTSPHAETMKELDIIVAELDLKEVVYAGRITTNKFLYCGFFSKALWGAKSAHEKLPASIDMKNRAQNILTLLQNKSYHDLSAELDKPLPSSPAANNGTLSKIRNRLAILCRDLQQRSETFHLS